MKLFESKIPKRLTEDEKSDLKAAQAAVAEMVKDQNEDCDWNKLLWNKNTIKDTFYYGEHKMDASLKTKLADYNKHYFKDLAYEMKPIGNAKTSWDKKQDGGIAELKFELVKK